jgi:ABC-type transporter MlaC component
MSGAPASPRLALVAAFVKSLVMAGFAGRPTKAEASPMSANFIAAVLSAFLFIGIPGTAALADAASDATALVDRVHKAVSAIAHEGAAVPQTLRDSYDGPFIAQAALGKYWAGAPAADRAQFVAALTDAIVKALVKRLGRHRDQDFAILSTKTITNGDVVVRSRLSPPGQDAITVDWRVHRCKAGLCVADLIVGGASVTVQRRDDIAARLQANGGSLPKLIADLRKNPLRS